MIRGLATGLAGAIAAPAVTPLASAPGAPAAPHDHESAGHALPGQAPGSETAAPPAPPVIFDAHQTRTLTSLADRLVPGAAAAGVVGMLDRLVAVASPGRQRQFFNALGAFEREARTRFHRGWIELDDTQQREILQDAAGGAKARPRPPGWKTGDPIPEPPGPPPPATLRDHLDHLRTMVANTYYATPAGMKELGWTGRTAWKELPACESGRR